MTPQYLIESRDFFDLGATCELTHASFEKVRAKVGTNMRGLFRSLCHLGGYPLDAFQTGDFPRRFLAPALASSQRIARLSRFVAQFLFCSVLCTPAVAAVPLCSAESAKNVPQVFVKTWGDDNNSGFTWLEPKQTVLNAVNVIKSGGTLWVMATGPDNDYVSKCQNWSTVPSASCNALDGLRGSASAPIAIRGCLTGSPAAQVRVLGTTTHLTDPRGAHQLTVHEQGSGQWERVLNGASAEFRSSFLLPPGTEKPEVYATFRDGDHQNTLARYTRVEDFRTSDQTFDQAICIPEADVLPPGKIKVGVVFR